MAALVVAIAAAALVLTRGGDEYRLTLRFDNASQLVKGNEVKVGGLPVGTVDDIVLADDNAAEVKVRITDEDLTPLHEGTRAEIRVASLSSVANRFIQLHPGPNNAPEIADGGTLATARTNSVVEIDSLLATLDAQTRNAAQDLLRNQAAIYEGAAAEANRGLVALNPALSQLDLLSRDLGRDNTALRGFLVRTASVVAAVASRDADLDRGLAGAATTARTLADEQQSLEGVLRRAPGTLADATGALNDLDRTFTALRPAARELRPVAPRAAGLVRDLQPVLDRSGPAIASLRGLLPDLGAVLRRMPALRDTALASFTATRTALADADPIVQGVLPYLPDVYHGVVTGFGGQQVNSYDANGPYARITPVASQLSLTGALSGLTKGLPLPFKNGRTSRCAGGAYRQVTSSPNNTPTPGFPCDPGNAP
ncbi:MlaD family protein [Paraconexibacter algicola]|uniref:MlaD family protein n=1 Tax=Paraconexibacter algicola TaxID=2133960 RepID=UPI001304C2C5|nr:MlaD family protein [Paraconexibacter algicola]